MNPRKNIKKYKPHLENHQTQDAEVFLPHDAKSGKWAFIAVHCAKTITMYSEISQRDPRTSDSHIPAGNDWIGTL